MTEFISHVGVVAFLLACFYVVLMAGTREKLKSSTVFCEAGYNQLKKDISSCRTEYRLQEIGKEVENFFEWYQGKIDDERLRVYYNYLNRLVNLRMQELTGNIAYG